VELICLVAFALAVSWFSSFRPWLKALVVVNIFLAIGCQVIALPKTEDLEVFQSQLGDTHRFPPLMRIRNLFHIAVGDFAEQGLDYGNPILSRMATVDTEDRIFVFRIGPYVSRTVQELLIALWAILLAVTVAGFGLILTARPRS
jgi:hypothetical protein